MEKFNEVRNKLSTKRDMYESLNGSLHPTKAEAEICSLKTMLARVLPEIFSMGILTQLLSDADKLKEAWEKLADMIDTDKVIGHYVRIPEEIEEAAPEAGKMPSSRSLLG